MAGDVQPNSVSRYITSEQIMLSSPNIMLTHPPTDRRVPDRLRAQANRLGHAPEGAAI